MPENVTDYGAQGNGSADDTQAINAAADAAGPGGTVYFPPGTYLVGRNDRIPIATQANGNRDDITWAGEDADNTTIKIAGGQTQAHFIFHIKGDSVTFRDLTIDGNKDAQGDVPGLCVLTEGTGQFTMRNCRVRRARNSNVKHSGKMTSLIENTHFHNAGYTSNGGHAISPNQTGTITTTIRSCLFTDQMGADIDVGTGQDSGNYPPWQTVIIEDCYAENSYRGFLKLSDSNSRTVMRNCITVGNSNTEIPVKANPGTAGIGTVVVEDSVIDGSKFPGIDLPRPGNLQLDNVAIKNAGRGGHRRGAGLHTDKMDVDGGVVSIHGTDVLVEFIGSARGSIDEIIHEGQPLGRDNGIVDSTRQGSPLTPDVPTKSEVGPYASGGGISLTKDLVIRGTGVPTNYRITVDGSIMPGSDVESWDVIDGNTIQGWVTETTDVDRFTITGTVEDIEYLEGDAVVTVNGDEVDLGDGTGDGNGDGNGTGDTPARAGISGEAALALAFVGIGLAYARQRD